MMPMAKKSGRTVLGVRMGLGGWSVGAHASIWISGSNILPGLESLLAKGRV